MDNDKHIATCQEAEDFIVEKLMEIRQYLIDNEFPADYINMSVIDDSVKANNTYWDDVKPINVIRRIK